LIKLSLSAYAYLIKFWKVDVMEAKPARQFPDPLNLIEGPEVHVRLGGQFAEFFYAPVVEADQHEQ
jgi:hypothetical protein